MRKDPFANHLILASAFTMVSDQGLIMDVETRLCMGAKIG